MSRRVLFFNSVSSEYTPPTANLVAQYDASVSSSVHATATFISQWDDLSGNGNHLLQAIAGKQPVYSGSGTSSIIDFSAAGVLNGFLKTAAFTLNQPITIYIIAQQTSWTSGYAIFDANSIGSEVGLFTHGSSLGIAPYSGSFGGTNTDWAISSTDYKVLTTVFNNTATTLSVNDGTKTTGTTGNNNAGGFTLAADASGASNKPIKVKYILIYNTNHSAVTQTAIITGIRSNWGI